MRPMTRLAVFGLTAAALLGGGQSANAQVTMLWFSNQAVIEGDAPSGPAQDFAKVTLTQNSSTQIGVKFEILANPPTGFFISNAGLELSPTAVAATPTVNFSHVGGVVADDAGYFVGGTGINNAGLGGGPTSAFFNAAWNWPPPQGNATFIGAGTSSTYNINFANSITLANLLTANPGGYVAGLKVAGYEGRSAVLGGRLFAVPEPASILAGLLGLPCVGGVVSLIRRRVGGAVVA